MSPIESLPIPKWADAIDILLISFLIHRLIVLFRGTTTRQVSVVLVILWVFHELTRAAGLILTTRFLEALGTVAVLVIVVAFRNEIREVLVQTNPAKIFLGHPNPRPNSNRLNAAVEATFRMAAERTGALLVFQNRDRLGLLIRDGIPLGGQLSVPILESLFSKKSPVHDGAVIIRGNKIERVGVILPLTQQDGLPAQFGTRHRAAIGLSELCDAVVVVASEERGEVSVGYRGEIRVLETPVELERLLQRLLGWDHEGKRAAAIRREFFRQVGGFALTALAIATYWMIFFGQQGTVTTITVPVDFQNIPEGLELSVISQEKVDVQIRGQRPLIDDLKQSPERVVVSVDLDNLNAGRGQTLYLTPENIELPVGLEVVRISPTSLIVDLDRQSSKSVPIRPQIITALPEDARIYVEPETVRLIGPESSLQIIQEVATSPIELGPTPWPNSQMTWSVDLETPAEPIRFEKDEPRKVRVTIRLPQPEPAEAKTPKAP